ncbi:hypothetical protein mflW37_3580 [Mesoplasma florum W37]|uniref:Uncharacterized protein n=1 Tax=Mesoplasma florum TaxID=2151 RepID=A0AAD2JE53_MESFO|nr:hypothetical protein [Mesoplasma florum]AGY41425.1 hypothetical protein mflW37_3580 [Mesoplasma florum W37]AVN59643.1 hypothetical protein CG008_01860 [Mesoplasma florum]AVN65766.1 hypothetical protein MflW12_3610 [Mesoplasma florum]
MKTLLSVLGAIGLSATAASPIISLSTEENIKDIKNDKVNLEYGTNSLTPYDFSDNYLRRATTMNKFSGRGVETVESNFTVPLPNAITVNDILNDSKIDTINYGGIFNIEAASVNQRFTAILLKRDPSQNTKDKAVFMGNIHQNNSATSIGWSLDLELTYYIDSKGNAFADIKLNQTVVDGYRYTNSLTGEVGVKIFFKTEHTHYYINNTVSTEQDMGTELLATIFNISSSNSAVVTTKDRVINQSISGLTGSTVSTQGINLQNTKRVSFYGTMRRSIQQAGYNSNIMLDSIDFIKNEELSTEYNLVFETNYETIGINESTGNWNSSLNLTLNINIDPATNRATLSNKGIIDLDNSETTNANTWMETTWVFDRASLWG